MLSFSTTDPRALLAAIKAAIDSHHIETWAYDSDGDFTHTPPQWRQKAWLRPSIATNELQLGILVPQGTKVSTEIYAIYHGRFIEMMLAHFDKSFVTASTSALCQKPDIMG